MNPDAPEDDARAEYEADFGVGEDVAESDWDGCEAKNVSGQWSVQAAAPDHAAVVERLTGKAESAGLEPEDWTR